jgi:competence protein ComGF
MKKKMRAFALLESLLALVVISACFAIGIAVYNNVSAGNRSAQKLKAEFLLADWAFVTKAEKRFLDESQEREGLKLERRVSGYGETTNVHRIDFYAYVGERKIAEYHELIRKP